MMKLDLFQVDAFTSKLFSGNPAAIVPLEEWLEEELMQQIAMENNLSETAFFTPSSKKGIDYEIRWFTPQAEINLCGHATLACAYIIFEKLKAKKKKITFSCKSGVLKVSRRKKLIDLDFPSWKPTPVTDIPAGLSDALGGTEIVAVYQHRDLLVELKSEEAVQHCRPDFQAIQTIGQKVIITAPGTDTDFVSRFFAPTVGVNEDPFTGSAHSQLIPFWSERLKKSILKARQLSKRGGELECMQLNEDRVIISGQCVFYKEAKIRV